MFVMTLIGASFYKRVYHVTAMQLLEETGWKLNYTHWVPWGNHWNSLSDQPHPWPLL